MKAIAVTLIALCLTGCFDSVDVVGAAAAPAPAPAVQTVSPPTAPESVAPPPTIAEPARTPEAIVIPPLPPAPAPAEETSQPPASANVPPSTTPSPGSGAAVLTWLPPTENTDGSALTNLAGYRVYSGSLSTALRLVRTIDSGGITTAVIDGLASGTHYFAVSAFSYAGSESELSEIRSKSIP